MSMLAVRKLLFACCLSTLSALTHGALAQAIEETEEIKAPPQPVVTTALGKYRGQTLDDVHRFLGIKYAQSPDGTNRWQPPVPIASHSDVMPVEKLGPACLQVRAQRQTSEDCLSLNVWTPQIDGPKRPVMVWIHGGSFRSGSNDVAGEVFSSPTHTANPAVLVAINYRLGPLGFFSHSAIKSKTANFALLDMIMALKWINTHISDFGGDPENITIFGVSAGGMAVNMLMTSALSKGLFHKAIAQSGYGTWPLPSTRYSKRPAALDLDGAELPRAEKLGKALVKSLTRARQTKETLLGLAGQDLMNAQQGFQVPYVDGRSLKAEPGIRFIQNKQHKVPFITGGTSNEGTVMNSSGYSADDFSRGFGVDKKRLRKLYQRDFFRDDNAGWARVFGDNRYLLAAQVQGEAMALSQENTWLYYVDFVPDQFKNKWLGTPHGMDAWLIFNGHSNKDLAVQRLSSTIRNYWLNLAHYGNPNGGNPNGPKGRSAAELVHWPTYSNKQPQWLIFSDTLSVHSNVIEDKLRLLKDRYKLRIAPALNRG